MEITIQSVNFEPAESINAYVTKKLNKLTRFSEIDTAEVQLKFVNNADKSDKEVAVKVFAKDETFYASKNAESWEDATLQVVEALERQMAKSKGKKQ